MAAVATSAALPEPTFPTLMMKWVAPDPTEATVLTGALADGVRIWLLDELPIEPNSMMSVELKPLTIMGVGAVVCHELAVKASTVLPVPDRLTVPGPMAIKLPPLGAPLITSPDTLPLPAKM